MISVCKYSWCTPLYFYIILALPLAANQPIARLPSDTAMRRPSASKIPCPASYITSYVIASCGPNTTNVVNAISVFNAAYCLTAQWWIRRVLLPHLLRQDYEASHQSLFGNSPSEKVSKILESTLCNSASLANSYRRVGKHFKAAIGWFYLDKFRFSASRCIWALFGKSLSIIAQSIWKDRVPQLISCCYWIGLRRAVGDKYYFPHLQVC